MSRLVAKIVDEVRSSLRASVANMHSRGMELRSVFHGPPMELLRPVFDQLVVDGGMVVTLSSGVDIRFPILLQVEALSRGEQNPGVGESGPCDESHLLTLRNTPSCPRFLALVPPGRHRNLSVASATDELGLLPENNSGNATIEQWWEDDFVQRLVGAALDRNTWGSEAERSDAKRLIEHAVSAADEVDRHDVSRKHAWRALSRVFSISDPNVSFGTQLSLACGFPPMADGCVRAKEQIDTLEELADELVDVGFGPGIEQLKVEADPDDSLALDQCLAHLKFACDIPTAFFRATPFYYTPDHGDEVSPPPAWWTRLTVERWNELLDDVPQPKGTLSVTCTNSIIPPCRRGVHALVLGAVELEISLPVDEPTPKASQLTRDAGGAANRRNWDLELSPRTHITDTAPLHRAPIRYKAEAAGLRSAGVKVISLEFWEPGVFAFCRTAAKMSVPKRPKTSREKVTYECELTLTGEGRHYVDLYVRPGVVIAAIAVGHDAGGVHEKPMEASVNQVSDHAYGFEVDASIECYYDVDLTDGSQSGKLRLQIRCDESSAEGCKSEFERLIRLNRQLSHARGSSDVQIDRHVRCADLQTWMLDGSNAERSYYPIVIAPDYASAWRSPEWRIAEDSLLSRGKFLHDPRPTMDEMQAPSQFAQSRNMLANRIRREDGSGLVESAQLGVWLSSEPAFSQLVEDYVRSYTEWLQSSPDVAAWADVALVVAIGPDGKTLGQEPDAILLSPLHPLRIGWHAVAQRALYVAYQRNAPCPAASVLDPGCVPDALVLPLRTTTGDIKRQVFFSTESTSDYWTVLWNASRLDRLAARTDPAPLNKEMGIQIGGASSGFSVSQVHRALSDVSSMLSAKTVLNALISSAPSQNDACNEGILSWCREQFVSPEGDESPRSSVGARLVHVYDDRKELSRPEDAEISNVAEDTQNSVRWFGALPEGTKPDIGIVAQLESANPDMSPMDIGSPVGIGALIRQRIRRQLPANDGAFLIESRMGSERSPSGDGLADKVMAGTVRLENLVDSRYGYTFAPNVHAIEAVLEGRRADYAAVSSSAVDPACFLGGWLDNAYLWDYDLPSYSHRAGDTNGYYLLSRIKEVDREALGHVLTRLPDCDSLHERQIDEIILEVARRGIPTVRGLASGATGATGDLGLLVASRMLQDEFRNSPSQGSLLPAVFTNEAGARLTIVVPVDPFRGYLECLGRALGQAEFQRPDLIVAGIWITDSAVCCKLTPVEVKFRSQEIMSQGACNEALSQCRSLSKLFGELERRATDPDLLIWKLAYQHLLISMIGFGFRVYSQHRVVAKQHKEWSEFHRRFVEAVLADELKPEICPLGRLIAIDKSPNSAPRDQDGDGFDETIILSARDAAEVVAKEPAQLYLAIRNAVGDWGLLPDSIERTKDVNAATTSMKGNSTYSSKHEPLEVPAEVSEPFVPIEIGSVVQAGPVDLPRDQAYQPGVVIDVGSTTESFRTEARQLNISDTSLNQLNIGIVGDLGTGKTQLVKSLVYQITRGAASNQGIKPRFLIFDYKKDYSTEDFVRAVGARVVKPQQLPINIFDVTAAGEALTPWLDRFKFFSDVLDKIFSGIGPVQRQQLKQAVRRAYEECQAMGRQPTIYDVHANYRAQLGNKTDSPLSIIDDIVDMELFSAKPGNAASFDAFLDGVVVIALNALGSDDRTKNMLVAFMLNMYYEHMLRIPKRPYVGTSPQLRVVDSFLLVDEADSIMRYEFDVLRKLLLQGREFGVGVMLASQYLRHFKTGATDYREPLLTWFIHKVPNITPQELTSLGLTKDAAQIADRIKVLANHQCLFKTFNVDGDIVKGTPFFEILSKH